ncbi:AbrB family transcriptional regulator [Fodinicurvata sp. EGI_FJ10296]|uniref:AbrB family transcriptional regulator n=1 Tax=Fodinicurvata sp. EGI_FJ10296 TaxID=3231908 RepID=UPI003453CB1C
MPSYFAAAMFQRLSSVDYVSFGKAIAIGTVGGAILAWFSFPLAWMIGAMLTTAAASLAHVQQSVPRQLRSAMVMILGIMLGSSFHPDIINDLSRWAVTVVTLVPYIILCVLVGVVFLRRFGQMDPVTAYFTATPGGLNEMVIIGGQLGGDDRTIALSHSSRIMIVVVTIPFWFQLFGGIDAGSRGALGPDVFDIPIRDYLLLALCVLGAPIALYFRLPAAVLVGPMVLSALIHLGGWTNSSPPALLIATAQVVVGAAIGARFVGMSARQIGKVFLIALGLTALMLSITVAFALVLHQVTGIDTAAIVLAYAPGGLAEMSLIALALDVDAAFVATHHIVRIIVIVLFAPAAFKLVARFMGTSNGPDLPLPNPTDDQANRRD